MRKEGGSALITIKEYIKPRTIEEAYEELIKRKKNVIFGGGAFIRMGSRTIPTAIDLSDIGLDYIEEKEETIEIGAMTTLGDIEYSEILSYYYNNMLAKSVKEIVGIQLRNIVTIVYSRYSFSDPITGLLALDTQIKLYKQGNISLEKFLNEGPKEKDILEKIIIKKDNRKATFLSMRNSKGDYAILNVAVSMYNHQFRIAVGARPGPARLAYNAMEYLEKLNGNIDEKNILEVGKIASEELVFGTNSRGSSLYRKQLASTLVNRALMEVMGLEN